MTYTTLKFETDGQIATITLNRPDFANGLNAAMAAELKAVARICENAEDIRVVILTGAGTFFCAGGDIKEMSQQGPKAGQHIKNLADDLHAAISTFSRMDQPVIMAVNGTAAGAGFSLAVSGDLVVASPTAKFTMAYTKAGLSPDGSSSYFLPRLIGLRRTQDLMFTNRVLSSEDALDWGLINYISEPDDVLARAWSIAKLLVQGARASNAAIKKLLLSSFSNTLETQMEIEGRMISACAASPDGQEGIKAFVEKRPPQFDR